MKPIEEFSKIYSEAKNFRSSQETGWLSDYNVYKCISEREVTNGGADVYVPEVFSVIETIMPYMTANPPRWQTKPGGVDDIDKVKNIDVLMDYYWDVMKMKRKTPAWVKEGLIYGTAPAKIGWDLEKDRPYFDPIDIFYFYIEPRATSVQSSRYVLHKVPPKTLKEIKEVVDDEGNQVYSNLRSITSGKPDGYDSKDKRLEASGLSLPAKSTDEIDLVEWWTRDNIRVVANGSTIIYDKPNRLGFLPFVAFIDQEVPHEFYGIGECGYLKKLQYLINTLTNQRLDNINLTINNMWLKTPQSDIDESQLVSTPGGIIETLDINGIKPLEMSNVTSGAYTEVEMATNNITRASGTFDYARGQVGEGNASVQRTATGVSLIQEAAVSRFKKRLQNYEFAIEEIGEMLLAMTQKYMEAGKFIRIVGSENQDEFQELFPEDMDGQFDIRVEAGSTIPTNENTKRNVAEIKFNMFKEDPFIDQYQLRKTILDAYGEKNIDKLLQPGEEGMQELTRLQMAGQMAATDMRPEVQQQMQGQMGEPPMPEAQPGQLPPENEIPLAEEAIQSEQEGPKELPTQATPQAQGALAKLARMFGVGKK